MKKLIAYVVAYARELNKVLFFILTLFTAIAVFVNYHFQVNRSIFRLPEWGEYIGWYLVFAVTFGFGHRVQAAFSGSNIFKNRIFLLLLLLAPAIFAWKMAADVAFEFSGDVFENEYWNNVVYWPFKVVILTGMVYMMHRFFDREQPLYGTATKGFTLRPYLFMLLLMLPLVAAAATQKDFLAMYPRFQNVAYLLPPDRGWHKLLYELSYGTDFFSIELYFRGFLVLAFARFVGKDAILPMAMFYCTIHFGKPLGECISSYFGGLLLGIVTYHTRTIWGGFLVHVGIAWLMELGGYLSKEFL